MPKIDTIYLVHHSHTDIGYTNDQPIVWDLNTRFIDEALHLAEKHADEDDEAAFKWTIETTSTFKQWLDYAKDTDIMRLQKMEKAGRIEITGMFAHLTPLVDTDQLLESFQLLRSLRNDYGFEIAHAMNCDVNGLNWPAVDVMLDVGLKGFSMAINTHFGGAVKPRPLPFLWQGPSGRSLPVMNGWTYDKGWREGIGHDAKDFAEVCWPRLQTYLDQINYPLPILMLQSYHPYGDVGTAFDFTDFIRTWNESGQTPRIVMATPRMWWKAVEEYHSQLQVLRGDWTDFWNFGAISSARETSINRRSREYLRQADVLNATLTGQESVWAKQSLERYRERAYWNLHMWDEHTWGADLSIRIPEAEDTQSQWNHKANYAYTARSLSQMLRRDGLADLARLVERESNQDILVFNPSPFKRKLSGKIPYHVLHPRGLPDDSTAGRHHQDRSIGERYDLRDDIEVWGGSTGVYVLSPTELEGYGYQVVKREDLHKLSYQVSENAVVENDFYRIEFDTQRGAIKSFYDKQQNYEWVDQNAVYRLGEYVYECVADYQHPWPRKLLAEQNWSAPLAEIPIGWQTDWKAERQTPQRLLSHKVYKSEEAAVVVQTFEAAGCDGVLTQHYYLPVHEDYLEVVAFWDMTRNTHPEASYLMFPFNLPEATARLDLGGQMMQPEADQLPGVCRDYFTVQNWVDFANQQRGMMIATPENPLVQLDNFHFAHYQQTFKLEKSLFLGWVTNNYWETNFRAHQPGRVEARYRLRPYQGKFDESRAHRFGAEAMNPEPAFQQLGEPSEREFPQASCNA